MIFAVVATVVPALELVTAPVEFVYAPATVDVTRTDTTQEPEAGIVPAESARDVPPPAAVAVPPQLFASIGDDELTRLAG